MPNMRRGFSPGGMSNGLNQTSLSRFPPLATPSRIIHHGDTEGAEFGFPSHVLRDLCASVVNFHFYAYNPVAKTICFYYTSSEGEMTIGTAAPDPDGKTLHQEFDILHTNGRTGHIRSSLVRDGNDAYWFTVFMQKDGAWA